jgi:hypothetical protein
MVGQRLLNKQKGFQLHLALHVCARGDGIRGSKDLRAEIGKYSNSTNERKKMSTKTIKQRIAIVAATVLTAGFLSVVSAPVANATAGTIATGANASSTTGYLGTFGSVGLLKGAEIVSGTTTTHTATLLSTGTLNLTFGAASSVAVSAGAIITTASSMLAIAQDQSYAVNVTTVGFKPTGAVGTTFRISVYSETDTIVSKVPDSYMTVTIAGSSVAGVPVASESTILWASGAANTPTSTESVTNASTTYDVGALYVYIDLEDAYGANINSSTGALVVTASEGALVGTPGASGAAGAGVTNVGITNSFTADRWAVISQKTAGAGWSGTVTVAYNGVTLATLSGKITGAPATITTTARKIGKTGTNIGAMTFLVKDAAGNGLAAQAETIMFDTSSVASVVTTAGGTGSSLDAAFGGALGDYVGTADVTCGVAGVSNVTLKMSGAAGAVIKSSPVAVRCGGDAYDATMSWDKASYVQGEIATLTVAFVDSKGNPANSYTKADTITSTETDATISVPMMTQIGSLFVATDGMLPNKDGKKIYTFTVGSTTAIVEGSYNAVLKLPTIDVSVTAPYKVSTGTNAVSNADVLKSIVSLIASINKQIQALQKLILKR